MKKLTIQRFYVAEMEVEAPDNATIEDIRHLVADFQPSDVSDFEADGWMVFDDKFHEVLNDQTYNQIRENEIYVTNHGVQI